MARKELFQAVVDSLSADDLDDFLARRLAGCEDEIAPAAVLPGCTVLLGLYPRLRSQSKGFLDVGPEFAVDRVVLQLLVAERDPLWLLATALAEDPGDRGDIDDLLLQDDTAAAALLLSAAAQVRAREMGSVAVQTEQMLRWQFLGTVVGDDKAIATMVDRVAAARADDEAVMAVVALARKYLAGWRPSEFPFGSSSRSYGKQSTTRTSIFSPSVISGGWPALLIRAVTTYEVDPAWAARADVSGAEFHHRLAAFLDGVSACRSDRYACRGPGRSSRRRCRLETRSRCPAVRRRRRAAPDPRPRRPARCSVRYAVFLPGNTGPVTKLITDIAVSPGEPTDAKWGKLGLEGNPRRALAAALEAAGGTEADRLLRSIYYGEMPPRTIVELYLMVGARTIRWPTLDHAKQHHRSGRAWHPYAPRHARARRHVRRRR